MQTYKEMYEKGQKDKSLKLLTPVYQEWKKPGEQVIGAFISKGEVSSSVSEGRYYQYVFETDKGNVKFHMGSSADNDVGAALVPGVVYAITYEGKEELPRGRRVNKFLIEELGPTADYSSEPATDG